MKPNNFHLITLFSILLWSCDSFQEDLVPTGERELEIGATQVAIPNTPLFIDLKRSLQTSEIVRFEINQAPSKGTATISHSAILEYNPSENFIIGSDFLTVDLINQQGFTIDNDSIIIQMGDSSSLPCLNGAISDFYRTPRDTDFILVPIENDGFCQNEVTDIELIFIEDPQHGELIEIQNRVDAYSYRYIPDSGFLGVEEFLYELNLTDLEGGVHTSMARVTIEVYEEITQSPCDSLVYPSFYEISDGGRSEYYLIQAYLPDPFCGDFLNSSFHILNVYSGSAEVFSSNLIRYIPGTDSIDFIEYLVYLRQDTVFNTLTISIDDYVVDDPWECARANDDEFYFYIAPDSSGGTESRAFVIDPLNNDEYCNDSYELSILELPEIGVATLVENRLIEWLVEEEFTGIVTTSITYQLCNEQFCDEAIIHLTVEQ